MSNEEPVDPGVPNLDDPSLRRASDVGATGGGATLHDDVPRIPLPKLLGKNIDFLQVDTFPSTIREDSKFAVIRFRALENVRAKVEVEGEDIVVKLKPGDEGSTATGSLRVVDQLTREGVRFPFAGQIRERENKPGYEVADPHA